MNLSYCLTYIRNMSSQLCMVRSMSRLMSAATLGFFIVFLHLVQ